MVDSSKNHRCYKPHSLYQAPTTTPSLGSTHPRLLLFIHHISTQANPSCQSWQLNGISMFRDSMPFAGNKTEKCFCRDVLFVSFSTTICPAAGRCSTGQHGIKWLIQVYKWIQGRRDLTCGWLSSYWFFNIHSAEGKLVIIRNNWFVWCCNWIQYRGQVEPQNQCLFY